MNEQKLNNRNRDFEDDRALDRMLDACRFQPIDNTRIKNLVHEKIHNEKMARKRRMRRIFAVSFSAAACLALVVAFGLSYFASSTPDLSSATPRQLAGAGYKELIVPAGTPGIPSSRWFTHHSQFPHTGALSGAFRRERAAHLCQR